MFRIRLQSAVLVFALAASGVLAVPLTGADYPPTASTRQASPRPDTIKDRLGRTLGTIRYTSNGRLEARSRLGSLLGTYDPKTNVTRDRLGRVLNEGNTLSALVVSSAQEGKH
jgi:hypothetical protein